MRVGHASGTSASGVGSSSVVDVSSTMDDPNRVFTDFDAATNAIRGDPVGVLVDTGPALGAALGPRLGTALGAVLGPRLGLALGAVLDVILGVALGDVLGVAVGIALGAEVGVVLGTVLGTPVGVLVDTGLALG
jgi:hypothetical protein